MSKIPSCYAPDAFLKLKMHQNSFLAGDLPQAPLGELTTLPTPSSRLGRKYPFFHFPPPRRLRCLDWQCHHFFFHKLNTVCLKRLNCITIARLACPSVVNQLVQCMPSDWTSSYGRRTVSVAGPMTWNSRPRHLRDPVHTISVFGRLLKTFSQNTNVCSSLRAFLGVDKFTFYLLTYLFTYSILWLQLYSWGVLYRLWLLS